MAPGPRNEQMERRARRVSLPIPGGLASRQQTNLTEAKGLLADMLSWDDLSPQVLTGLRALGCLLSQHHTGSLSDSATLQRIAEDPITGEQICLGWRNSSTSRVPPVVWSTVTSATGLPTVEPEPSRSRSSSFWKKHRGNIIEDGTAFENDGSHDGDTDTRITVPDGTKFDTIVLNDNPFLKKISDIDFPIFTLAQRSPKSVLTEVSYKIFTERNLFSIFRINLRKFLCFFHKLEMGYLDIPYHNRIHAADVSQLTYVLCSRRMPAVAASRDSGSEDQTLGSVLSSLELMALFAAAAMHDYDHPGKTNAFLVAAKDPKAILYNDRSVLENHHAASSWQLLSERENNWIQCLDDAEYKRFRYLVIEAILSTDLKRHFDILAEYNAKTSDGNMLDWNSEQDRLLVCQMCIKIADISAPARQLETHKLWTNRILEEFYQQGDEERAYGFPVSAYMDRRHPQVAKLQDSFITHLVSPLADAMAQSGLLPMEETEDEPELMVNLCINHKVWLSELESGSSGMLSPSSGEMAVITENDNENGEQDAQL